MTNQNKNFIQRFLSAIKDPPVVVALIFLLAGTFWGGLQFHKILNDKIIMSLETQKTELNNKNEELNNKNEELKNKNEELKNKNEELKNKNEELTKKIDKIIGCKGEIKSPKEGAKVPPQSKIEVTVADCANTRVWLIASPNSVADTGLDCYLIKEVAKGQTSEVKAHPLQEQKPYIVRLIKNNKNITDIPKRHEKETTDDQFVYNCSDIGFSESLDQINLDVQ